MQPNNYNIAVLGLVSTLVYVGNNYQQYYSKSKLHSDMLEILATRYYHSINAFIHPRMIIGDCGI